MYEGDIASNANPSNADGTMGIESGGGLSAGQWSMGFGLAGLGASIAGGIMQSKAQSQVYQDQEKTAQTEIQQNTLRQQQMNNNAARAQIENLRNVQRQHAAGLSAAVNSGSQFGSGLAGGQAQETAQGAWNYLGIANNQQLDNQMFSLDNQIDQYKIQIAQSESQANSAGGIAGIGKSVLGAAGSLGQLATLFA